MKTYAYGCLAPTDPDARRWVFDELYRAGRYRNALVALAKARRERLAVAKRDGLPDWWIDSTKAEHKRLSREARKASGLGWGTYQLVEDDVKRAVRSGTPQFRRNDGTGRVGASVQACDSITVGADDARVVIGTPDARRRTTITLRMAAPAGERGTGRLITLPIVLHRDLPAGEIVRAYIQVERVGLRTVWGVRIVMHEAQSTRARCGSGAVAVNLGWRSTADGIIVATALSDCGIVDRLVIPHALLDAYRHAEELRALADREAHEYLGDSRRRSRARREALRQPDDGHRGNRSPWASAQEWARQDRHLYQWECDERTKTIRRRRAIALAWVQRLAETYERVSIDAFRLEPLIKHGASELPEARHVRFMVAPGELRELLTREFGKARVAKPVGAHTVTCSACGNVCAFDRVHAREHTCEWCGDRWDQDVNNAANQLVGMAAE